MYVPSIYFCTCLYACIWALVDVPSICYVWVYECLYICVCVWCKWTRHLKALKNLILRVSNWIDWRFNLFSLSKANNLHINSNHFSFLLPSAYRKELINPFVGGWMKTVLEKYFPSVYFIGKVVFLDFFFPSFMENSIFVFQIFYPQDENCGKWCFSIENFFFFWK